MRILMINNDGGGYAGHVEVEAGTTVSQFFDQHMTGRKAADYMIRVDRLPAAADQVLQEGNRISITPVKITGA